MAATTQNLSDRKAAPAGSAPLLWARLGSLLSVLPLGVWTLNHLADNLSAYGGAEAWQRQVTSYSSPISHGITLIVVLGPLLVHMVWGIQRMFTFRPNNVTYSTWGNTKYIVQRVAGVGVLFFLGAHIWLAMLQPRLVHGHPEQFNHIAATMFHHGPTLMVYLLGSLGVAYHLANGVSTFAWQWGLVSGRKSLGRFDVLAAVIFVVTLVLAYGAIYALYQAGSTLPPVDL